MDGKKSYSKCLTRTQIRYEQSGGRLKKPPAFFWLFDYIRYLDTPLREHRNLWRGMRSRSDLRPLSNKWDRFAAKCWYWGRRLGFSLDFDLLEWHRSNTPNFAPLHRDNDQPYRNKHTQISTLSLGMIAPSDLLRQGCANLELAESLQYRDLVAPYCAIPRDYLSDTPLLRAMGFLVSQHGELGAIPPPLFLSVSPWRACEVEVRYHPSKGEFFSAEQRSPKNRLKIDWKLAESWQIGWKSVKKGSNHQFSSTFWPILSQVAQVPVLDPCPQSQKRTGFQPYREPTFNRPHGEFFVNSANVDPTTDFVFGQALPGSTGRTCGNLIWKLRCSWGQQTLGSVGVHLFALLSTSKSVLFCRAKGTAHSLEKAVSGLIFPQSSGRKCLSEIFVTKGQIHRIRYPERGVVPWGGFATKQRWSNEMKAMKTMKINRFIASPCFSLIFERPKRTLPDAACVTCMRSTHTFMKSWQQRPPFAKPPFKKAEEKNKNWRKLSQMIFPIVFAYFWSWKRSKGDDGPSFPSEFWPFCVGRVGWRKARGHSSPVELHLWVCKWIPSILNHSIMFLLLFWGWKLVSCPTTLEILF